MLLSRRVVEVTPLVTPLASPGIVMDAALIGASGSASAFPTLELFGVPYLTYGPDASRLHTSPALTELVVAEGPRQALVQQADRIAGGLLAQPCAVSSGMSGPSVPVPSVVGPYVLTAHRMHRGPRRIAAVVVVRPQAMAAPQQEPSVSGLTIRERQVMSLIAIGLGSKQIAARLGISPHTARHHTERVFEKLGVRSRAAVATLAAAGGSSSASAKLVERIVPTVAAQRTS